MEKLWTSAEVASVLGINEIDVEQLVREGKLTGYKLGGEFLRFRPSQVEALKGTIRFRAQPGRPRLSRSDPWTRRLREFLYFYDFYIVSATFLALFIVYLIASG